MAWLLGRHTGLECFRSWTGRTSMIPMRAGGNLEAIAHASSMSFASTRKNPPSCSFVSTKGPSVVETLQRVGDDVVAAPPELVVVDEGRIHVGLHLALRQRVQRVFVMEDHEHEPHRTLLEDGSL